MSGLNLETRPSRSKALTFRVGDSARLTISTVYVSSNGCNFY